MTCQGITSFFFRVMKSLLSSLWVIRSVAKDLTELSRTLSLKAQSQQIWLWIFLVHIRTRVDTWQNLNELWLILISINVAGSQLLFWKLSGLFPRKNILSWVEINVLIDWNSDCYFVGFRSLHWLVPVDYSQTAGKVELCLICHEGLEYLIWLKFLVVNRQ